MRVTTEGREGNEVLTVRYRAFSNSAFYYQLLLRTMLLFKPSVVSVFLLSEVALVEDDKMGIMKDVKILERPFNYKDSWTRSLFEMQFSMGHALQFVP